MPESEGLHERLFPIRKQTGRPVGDATLDTRSASALQNLGETGADRAILSPNNRRNHHNKQVIHVNFWILPCSFCLLLSHPQTDKKSACNDNSVKHNLKIPYGDISSHMGKNNSKMRKSNICVLHNFRSLTSCSYYFIYYIPPKEIFQFNSQEREKKNPVISLYLFVFSIILTIMCLLFIMCM